MTKYVKKLPTGDDILKSSRFEKAKNVTHHKKTSVAEHSKKTAEYGTRICKWLEKHNVSVNEEDVVRACLLHDIGMTDDQVHSSVSWKKVYSHPKRGMQIAEKEYEANDVQLNAIRRHMWPICIIPPKSIEGWVVVAADKCCSLWEVTHRSSLYNGNQIV